MFTYNPEFRVNSGSIQGGQFSGQFRGQVLTCGQFRGQVLTCAIPELPLRSWPDRCDSSLPVRSTTSPRAVTGGRTFFGSSVTGGCFSMCSRACTRKGVRSFFGLHCRKSSPRIAVLYQPRIRPHRYLWEGRFRASTVQEEVCRLVCYRYIELNLVRTRMVDLTAAFL